MSKELLFKMNQNEQASFEFPTKHNLPQKAIEWAHLENLPPTLMVNQCALSWDICVICDSKSCTEFSSLLSSPVWVIVLHMETKALGNDQQQTDGSQH